jgi:tRNA nucleotidyltransferase (CCA-adding enzyme)
MRGFKIPPAVKTLGKIFEQHKKVLYLVGGAVRNMVLGSEPSDWDLATDAKPEEIQSMFKKVIPTGIDHGTVTILFSNNQFEVTTFRIDGDYTDSRRPDSVEFTPSILEDLKRRDFTVNAMAIQVPSGTILDPHGGKHDLQEKIIRTVGNPDERFGEDALRVLRGIRFASILGFEFDIHTKESLERNAKNINGISIERIRDEFLKIILGPDPVRGLTLLKDLDVLKHVLPEILPTIGYSLNFQDIEKPYEVQEGELDLFKHLCKTMEYLNHENVSLRLAGLFHDIAKPKTLVADENGFPAFYGHEAVGAKMVSKILKRLKLPREIEKTTTSLVENHMFAYSPDLSDKSIRKFLSKVGPEQFHQLIALKRADLASKTNFEPDFNHPMFHHLNEYLHRGDDILNKQEPLLKSDLAVDGNKLAKLGIPKDKKMGLVLDYLMEAVIEDPEQNTEEKLSELAKNFYESRIGS